MMRSGDGILIQRTQLITTKGSEKKRMLTEKNLGTWNVRSITVKEQ